MKHSLFFFSLLLPCSLWAQRFDTTIRRVPVGFIYSKDIFPESWRDAPINATGYQIDYNEIPRSKIIIARALVKYPEGLLEHNLKHVFFLKDMKFYDVGYGGTNSNDAVYLTNQGPARGYTDRYLEQTFHHEFSSVLLRNFPSLLDTIAWKDINIPGFSYNDPENGVGAIRNNQSSQDLDSGLCEKGILTQYGGSSLENDVNTFAQNLFCPEKTFWQDVDRFPRIRKKTDLLIRFYGGLNPIYTESFFRKFDKH